MERGADRALITTGERVPHARHPQMHYLAEATGREHREMSLVFHHGVCTFHSPTTLPVSFYRGFIPQDT